MFIPYIYQCYLFVATALYVGAVPQQRQVTMDIFPIIIVDTTTTLPWENSCLFIFTSHVNKGVVLLSYVKGYWGNKPLID